MGLRVLTRTRTIEAMSAALQVTPASDYRLLLAASLRRAASLMCPTTPSALILAIKNVLEPLSPIDDDSLQETLDALVNLGDLVESVEQPFGRRQRVIYLGQPRFIQRRSGELIIFGTRPDNLPLIGDSLRNRVQETGYLRRIVKPDSEVHALLETYGVIEITEARWMESPEPVEAAEFVKAYVRELNQQSQSGHIDGLRILDPKSSPSFYRGRWRPPAASDTGTFLARRSQGYGSDLWCFVELSTGEHHKLLDLPLAHTPGVRGCDEAWRLQAAIDAVNGNPQHLTIQRTGRGRVQLGLPAPPPKWLQRRWDLLGEPVHIPSTLFAYEFAAEDTRDEAAFACTHLWMTKQIHEKEGLND